MALLALIGGVVFGCAIGVLVWLTYKLPWTVGLISGLVFGLVMWVWLQIRFRRPRRD